MAEYCSKCGNPYVTGRYERTCKTCGVTTQMAKIDGSGETWSEHCRRASEPEGLTTGLHRDSMG